MPNTTSGSIQSLLFPKKQFTRAQALSWAKKHGYKHYTSRETKNFIRVRQKPPENHSNYGLFSIGPVKAVYQTPTSRQPRIIHLAYQLKRMLAPYAYKIELAGSIRRKLSPRDIDIVLIPKDKNRIRSILRSLGKIRAEGEHQVFVTIQGINVDVFFAERTTFGGQLLTRTGSAQHNIGLRLLAKKKGMLLNQYGLYRKGKLIAGRSEQEIYCALDRPRFKKPEERS